MKYIVLKPKKLEISVVTKRGKRGFVIPVKFKSLLDRLLPLEEIVLHEIFYRAKTAEDKRRGRRRRYLLMPPDPWCTAIAYIMWQGIIQGFTWDAIKLLVKQALIKLGEFDVAPSITSERTNVHSRTEIGYRYTKYANNGRKIRDMFVGIRRVYNKKTRKERKSISRGSARSGR